MPTSVFTIGDEVFVGTGATRWRVVEFWRSHGTELARLDSVEGYSSTSVAVERLVLALDRPSGKAAS